VTTKTLQMMLRLLASVLLAALCVQPVQAQLRSTNPGGLAQIGIPAKPDALAQISVLLQEKEARSSAQQKIGSQLLYALQASHGPAQPNVAKIYADAAAAAVDSAGRSKVIIRASVSPPLLKQIERVGGTVTFVSVRDQSIAATVPLAALEALAANPDVRRIAPAPHVTTNVGALTSQGYISHKANQAFGMGYRGAGVKVGVLSDSVDALAAMIATGDLPAGTTVVPGQDGTPGSSEGTAMMEIVHDLAPDAQLFFATAFTSPDSFADNIRTLRFVYGCDIIVDDVSYSDEGAFQDTVIARAVNDVTANGALYFSSAGNGGNVTSGTSTTWEGDFANGGAAPAVLPPGYAVHSFGAQNFDRLVSAAQVVDLQWSDAWGASGNDYDLFVLDATGTTVLAASTNSQTGTDDPLEEIFDPSGLPANSRILIVKKASAADRALHLNIFFGDSRLQIATTGATSGHNAGINTVGTAATYWNSAHTGTRPFVGGAANPTEVFSSDGPRKIFFNPSGTAITPGNFLFGTNGGMTLVKPDIAAADGTSAKTPGFLPFFGTSAAAPHAAAIAALVKSARPDYTNAQILNAMLQTALDIRAPGLDRDSGHGIVMGLEAVNYALTH
jgi:hypothetical protein